MREPAGDGGGDEVLRDTSEDQSERIRAARTRFKHVFGFDDQVSITEDEIVLRRGYEKSFGVASCLGVIFFVVSITVLLLLQQPILIGFIPAVIVAMVVIVVTGSYNRLIRIGARDVIIDKGRREIEFHSRRYRHRIRIQFGDVMEMVAEHNFNGRWEVLHFLCREGMPINRVVKNDVRTRDWAHAWEIRMDSQSIADIIGVPIWHDYSRD